MKIFKGFTERGIAYKNKKISKKHMVEDIELLKEEIKEKLTEKRFLHSLSVMDMCEKLAKKYSCDVKRAKLVGLVHDMAKEMTDEEMLGYVKKNDIAISDTEKSIPQILHGKIAGDLAKKKYDFDDEMCEAISYHTTGKENMTLLQKILFASDKIDETRNYEGVEELRKLAFENLDEAIIKNIDETLKINIDKRKVILEESIKTRNYLIINRK